LRPQFILFDLFIANSRTSVNFAYDFQWVLNNFDYNCKLHVHYFISVYASRRVKLKLTFLRTWMSLLLLMS